MHHMQDRIAHHQHVHLHEKYYDVQMFVGFVDAICGINFNNNYCWSDLFFLKIIQQLLQMSERRLWTTQEDKIIVELVRRHGSKRWTEIAQDMKVKYPHLARSSKQIKERWYNHLDPEINRNPWTQEEEIIIFDAHRQMGSKWKQIAKLLTARTDNSIKNHFYSTLRRSLRRINKYLGFKNSTNQMRVLKPSILCKLIEDGQNNIEFRTLINGIFQFAKFKPNKATKTQEQFFIGSQKQLFKSAIQKLTQFNSKYNRNECLKTKQRIPKKYTRNSKNIPEHFTSQISLNSQKDMESSSNFKYLDISKATSTSLDQVNSQEGHKNNQEQYEQNDWKESNQNQFVNIFPEFQKPDQENYFVHMGYKEPHDQDVEQQENQTQKQKQRKNGKFEGEAIFL